MLAGLLAFQPPVSTADALDLLETAFELRGLRDGEGGAVLRRTESALVVAVQRCPVYERIERSGWRGVTACGSYHRRSGWYAAMGVSPEEELTGEQKWGGTQCSTVIRFPVAARVS